MKKKILFIVGLIFVLVINLYPRSLTINFPQFKDTARLIVEDNIRSIARDTVDKTYKDYNPLTRDTLAAAFVSQYKEGHKSQISKDIREEYAKLKSSYQDASGQTYLLEMDCWNWARYTQNVLNLGHPGDRLEGGVNEDSLMLAPSGSPLMWNLFLFYSSAFLYRIFCSFFPVALFTFLFYLPLFYSAIFFIILYFVIGRYWGVLAAAITCLFVGLAPDFLLHSSAGWFDMDVLSLLFPLLAVSAYAQSAQSRKLESKVVWIVFSAFWVGLFAATWAGWWFVFAIIVLYELFSSGNVACAYLQYKEKDWKSFKSGVVSLCLFISGSYLWFVALAGIGLPDSVLMRIRQAVGLNKGLTASLWPNVYTTVSEVGRIKLEDISQACGSVPLFFMALAFLLFLFLRTVKERKSTGFKRTFTIIMVFWFISLFFACFSGRRFTAFLHLPLGFALGAGASGAYAFFKKKKKTVLIAYSVLGVVIILGGQDLFNAYDKAKSIYPLMTRQWHRVLSQMGERTPQEAIINSWWDYGDWFKTVARRRVIFDGQSQNTPQAYWMANVLISANEEEAIRTLAMLNNGGNRAFETVDNIVKDPLQSLLLLKKVLALKPEAARQELLPVLGENTTQDVMHLLFDKPAKAFFIVDDSMRGKLGSISYLGSWDFVKAYLAKEGQDAKKNSAAEYLLKIKAADKDKIERSLKEVSLSDPEDLDEIVSGRLKAHSQVLRGKEKDGLVIFDKGFVYRPKEQQVYLYSPRLERFRVPKSLFIFENDRFKEVLYPDNDLALSLLVFKEKGEYRCVLLDRPLPESLFVRLYFLKGAGMKHFKPFMDEKLPGGGVIRVYEIIWE